MKFRNLMASAAVVALLPMSAQAFDIVDDGGSLQPNTYVASQASAVAVASAALDFEVQLDSVIPTDEDYTMTITLPGGLRADTTFQGLTFTGTDGAGNPVVADVQNVSTNAVDGVQTFEIEFDTDLAGGAPGDPTMTQGFDIAFGVDFAGCSDIGSGLTITIEDESGNVVETQSATVPTYLRPCVSGFQVAIADGDAAGTDALPLSATVTPPFSRYINNGFTDVHGTVFVTITDLTAPALMSATPAPVVRLDASQLVVAGDFDDLDFDVQLNDATGIGSVTAAGANVTAMNFAGTVVRFRSVGAVGPNTIALNLDGTGDLESREISVLNCVATLQGNLSGTIPCAGPAAINPLVRNTQVLGPYDWVTEGTGGTNAGANSIFRITGFTTDTPVDTTVRIFNSNAGGMVGPFTGQLTPVNGELVVSSNTGLGVNAAGYGRGDVQFEFISPDLIDVDRLVVQNGGVFSFGNLANGDD